MVRAYEVTADIEEEKLQHKQDLLNPVYKNGRKIHLV